MGKAVLGRSVFREPQVGSLNPSILTPPSAAGIPRAGHGEASAQAQAAAGSRHAVRQAHAGAGGAAHKRGGGGSVAL